MSASLNFSVYTVLYCLIIDGQTSLKYYAKVLRMMMGVVKSTQVVALSPNTLFILCMYSTHQLERSAARGVCWSPITFPLH